MSFFCLSTFSNEFACSFKLHFDKFWTCGTKCDEKEPTEARFWLIFLEQGTASENFFLEKLPIRSLREVSQPNSNILICGWCRRSMIAALSIGQSSVKWVICIAQFMEDAIFQWSNAKKYIFFQTNRDIHNFTVFWAFRHSYSLYVMNHLDWRKHSSHHCTNQQKDFLPDVNLKVQRDTRKNWKVNGTPHDTTLKHYVIV